MPRTTARTPSTIRFRAILLKPAPAEGTRRGAAWLFLNLPKDASTKLPSRGMVSVEGSFNGTPFRATLEPDGQGGHWLKVEKKLRDAAGADVGESVTLEITPVTADREPEPTVPPDLKKALAAAPKKAQLAWADITPAARRDFIHWIDSARQETTRVRRIANACDMLDKGKRRPCCFDRSGMYGKSMSCPTPEAHG